MHRKMNNFSNGSFTRMKDKNKKRKKKKSDLICG
jgi:hypothetical protein